MKKLRIAIITVLVLLVGKSVWACDIFVTPSKSKALVGDTVEVKVKVHLIHRRCVLPIEETNVDVQNGKVVWQSDWKKLNRTDYESVYKVVFYKSGKNRILVTRECSRVGLSEGSNYVTATYSVDRAISLARNYLGLIAEGKKVKTTLSMLEDVVKWLKGQKELSREIQSVIPALETVINSGNNLQKAKDAARKALEYKIFNKKEG